jgi:hypothetical protein
MSKYSLSGWESVMLLWVVLYSYGIKAQEVTFDLDWINKNNQWVLDGGMNLKNTGELIFTDKIKIPNGFKCESARIASVSSNLVSKKAFFENDKPSNNFILNWYEVTEKKERFIKFEITVLKKKGNSIEQLSAFNVNYSLKRLPINLRKSSDFTNESKFNSGDWYKIAVSETGIYKITYSFLKKLGVDIDNINPQNINIYGNGIGMLPLNNAIPRPDDVLLNRISIAGETDGVFNNNDYILFYAQGPDTWSLNTFNNGFTHKKHDYSNEAHYFIGIGTDQPSRIATQLETTLPVTYTMNEFDDYQFHENELVNVVGSGRIWLGEHIGNGENKTFNFSFPNVKTGSSATILTRAYGRAIGQDAQMNITVEGRQKVFNVIKVGTRVENNYARPILDNYVFSANDASFSVNLNYVGNSVSDGSWLDYIEINARRELKMVGSQMAFRDVNSIGKVSEIQLSSNLSGITFWDVSDVNNVSELDSRHESGQHLSKINTDSLKQFVAHTGSGYLTPTEVGKIANQNLHGMAAVNYVIITHPNFRVQSEDLASFHAEKQGLSTAVVNVHEIYNEFSSGNQDATAIKDFLRMLYKRSVSNTKENLKYVLLMGDGSYDNRRGISGNTNFIPTFQSFESFKATESFSTDDYFVLLDDNESYLNQEHIDAGIGRFPVQNAQEAQEVVNKSKRYLTGNDQGTGNLNTGDWKNKICFIADDEDTNTHLNQAIDVANKVITEHPEINIQKIFLDAYKQYSTPGGERYYEAQDDLKNAVQNGALLVNYTGHGGEVGWAHERVLDLTNIKGWSNVNRLPVFMTATCEFTRFDDPERTSAGEFVLLNPNGGGIALLSTTRAVYSIPNFNLNMEFYNHVLDKLDETGDVNRLGEIVRQTKNNRASGNSSTNHRNFGLFGDPALPINIPKHKIVTTYVNGVGVNLSIDSLKALDKITIQGEIRGENDSLLADYQGIVSPIVYGKEQYLQTLGNDGGSIPRGFTVRNNVMYKGRAKVSDGKFTFSFVVPKDISSAYGKARISYYGWNDFDDGVGFDSSLTVGGTSDNVSLDDIAPSISLFLNDEQFVNGGLSSQDPVLIAKLHDENGLNTVGTGIGHDLVAIIDGDVNKPIVLNDYYEADLDSYQSGKAKFQLTDLEKGPHTITLKAWDVYNNSAESTLEFMVANNEELILDHVLNYPNPFTSFTDFYFEHNQPGSLLNVRVQIFTVSGKLVKSIEQIMQTTGSRSQAIHWNGLDDYGDKIGRGAYIYKLKVETSDGKKEEQFEKLVKF